MVTGLRPGLPSGSRRRIRGVERHGERAPLTPRFRGHYGALARGLPLALSELLGLRGDRLGATASFVAELAALVPTQTIEHGFRLE
jgi:hypothetical protein